MGPVLTFVGAVFFGVGAGASLAYTIGVGLARLALLSLASKALTPKIDLSVAAADKLVTVKSTIQPQAFVYGTDMLSGPLQFAQVQDGNVLHRLVALTGREIDSFVGFRFDDVDIAIPGNIADASDTVSSGQYADVVTIDTRTGTATQTAIADLVSAFPDLWTSAHRARGWSQLYVKCTVEGNSEAFEAGLPQNLRATVKGHKVYDPRLDSTRVIDAAENLVTYSEIFSNAAWIKQNATIDIDVAAAPDSTNTMDRLNVSTANGAHAVTQEISVDFVAGDTYAVAVVVKDDGAGFAGLSIAEAAEDFFSVLANLSTGEIVATDTGSTGGAVSDSGVVDLGDGFYKIFAIGNTSAGGAGTGFAYVYAANSASPAFNTTGQASYTGVNGDDLLIWGFHVQHRDTLGQYVATVADEREISYGSGAHRVDTPSTWEWSENPALCLADWLIWEQVGMGEDPSRIDYEMVATAADICDELVDIPPVASPQTTQKRYTCNFTFLANQARGQIKSMLEQAMLGRCIYSQGKWRMFAGAALTADVTLSEANMGGGKTIAIEAATGSKERYNRVRGKFIDPSRNYTANPYPEAQNASYVTADGARIKYKTIDFNACKNSYEAQRNAIILLRQSRNQQVLQFEGNWSCFRVQTGHVVELDLGEASYSGKKFFVSGWELRQDGSGVTLTLVEETDSAWTDPAVGDYVTRTATGELTWSGIPAVKLSNATIENLGTDPIYAGVRAGADGRLRYGGPDNSYRTNLVPAGEWLGSGTDAYSIRATVTDGALASGTEDTWQSLDVDRTWFVAVDSSVSPSYNETDAIVTLEITNDPSASPVPILASADYTLNTVEAILGGFFVGFGAFNYNGSGNDTEPPAGTQSGDILVAVTTDDAISGWSSAGGSFPSICVHGRTATGDSNDIIAEGQSGSMCQIFCFRDNATAEYQSLSFAENFGFEVSMRTSANTDLTTPQDFAILLYGSYKTGLSSPTDVNPNGAFTQSGERITGSGVYIIGYNIQLTPASESAQVLSYAPTATSSWYGSTCRVKIAAP